MGLSEDLKVQKWMSVFLKLPKSIADRFNTMKPHMWTHYSAADVMAQFNETQTFFLKNKQFLCLLWYVRDDLDMRSHLIIDVSSTSFCDSRIHV